MGDVRQPLITKLKRVRLVRHHRTINKCIQDIQLCLINTIDEVFFCSFSSLISFSIFYEEKNRKKTESIWLKKTSLNRLEKNCLIVEAFKDEKNQACSFFNRIFVC